MQKPFDIMRWESADAPTPTLLHRMLAREGLRAVETELPPATQTPEMAFEQVAVRVPVSGQLQFSFPGYGVIELEPGDVLEIHPGVLHDIIVTSPHAALMLEALRE